MHASIHGGSVERRVWGKAKPWRAHVRHGKGKSPSKEPRTERSWENQELGTEKGKRPHSVKCKPGVHNDRTLVPLSSHMHLKLQRTGAMYLVHLVSSVP